MLQDTGKSKHDLSARLEIVNSIVTGIWCFGPKRDLSSVSLHINKKNCKKHYHCCLKELFTVKTVEDLADV